MAADDIALAAFMKASNFVATKYGGVITWTSNPSGCFEQKTIRVLHADVGESFP